ncbi:protein RNA-directed DNA methylation 3 isoform X2 [Aristolochia californica]
MDDLGEATRGTNKTGKAPVLPFLVKEEEMDEDLENFIKERYSHVINADDSQDAKGLNDQMSMMHSMKDPIIWRVKCMVGHEQQLAICLMQKFVDLQELNTKLQIISAFAIDHLKGCIFVEAEKESDVIEACKGYCNLYTTRMSLVPQNEVPHLLSVQHKSCGLSKGMWVRIKNGKYKGDLAQVVAVEEGHQRAMIKLIPRIDLQAIAKKFGGGTSLKQTPVPAPRLIRSCELEDFRPHIERKRDRLTGEVFEILDDLMLKEGFLYKKVSLGSLSYWDIEPSADEEQRFKMKTGISDDLDWLSELYEGQGKVYPVSRDERKDGISGTKNKCSFELHDFVLFGRKDFGVIIGVEGEAFKVIKGVVETTEVVTLKLLEIKKRLCDKMFTAPDSYRTTIRIGDTVRILSGPFEGREGFLRHLYKGTIFIHDNSNPEYSGYFCTKSELCKKINLKGTCKGMQDVPQPSGFLDSSEDLTLQPEKWSSRERGQIRSFRSNYQGKEERFSIGQTLRIRVGPLKGHLCRVIALHRLDLTVKLLSQSKVIKVSHDHVSELKSLSENSFGQVTSEGVFKGDSDKGFGSSKETTGWKSELPSSGRDSWNFSSTFSFDSAFAKTLDSIFSSDVLKTDQGDEAGVSKTSHTDQSGELTDGWAKAVEKAKVGLSADPWERKSNQAGESDKATDGWEKAELSLSADPWERKSNQAGESDKATDGWEKVGLSSSADPWESKLNQADEPDKSMGGWGKAAVGSIADPWVSKSNQAGESTDGWEKKAAVGSSNGPWASKLNQAGKSDKGMVDWEKTAVGSSSDPWVSKLSQAGESVEAMDEWEKRPASGSSADPWASKLNQAGESNKAIDGWEKVAHGSSADPWERKLNLAGDSDKAIDVCQKAAHGSSVDAWEGKSNQADESDKATDGWEKAALGSSADPWQSKSNQTCKSNEPFDGWGKAPRGSNQAGESDKATAGWEKAAGGSSAIPVEIKSIQTGRSSDSIGGWEKAAVGSIADPWEAKSNQACEYEKPTNGQKKAAVGSSANQWEGKSNQAGESNEAVDGWQKAATLSSCDPWEKTGKQAGQSIKASVWDKTAFGSSDDTWGNKVDPVCYTSKSVNGLDRALASHKPDSWSKAVDDNSKKNWHDSSQVNVGTKDAMGSCADSWKNAGISGGWGDAAKDVMRQERIQNDANSWRSTSFGGEQGWGRNKKSDKASEGDQGSGFDKRGMEDDGDGWRGQSGGWNKLRAFEGGRGAGGRRGGRGGRGGRVDYSSRGRGDFSNKGRFSVWGQSGWNQNQENDFSGGGGIPGDDWNDNKGDEGQARWNRGAYFEGGRSGNRSECWNGAKGFNGDPGSSWSKGKGTDREAGGTEKWNRGRSWNEGGGEDGNQAPVWKNDSNVEKDKSVSGWKMGVGPSDYGDKKQSDGWTWGKSHCEGQTSRNQKTSNKDDGSNGLDKWNREKPYGCGRSAGWKRGPDTVGGAPNSSWDKSKYCGGGDSVYQDGRGGDHGWRGGRRGGGRGGRDFGRGRGRGFFGEHSSSGWSKGDKGGFGGNGSYRWKNGDEGGFGGNGSYRWKNGDEGGFGGNGSSGWNKTDRGDFGGNGSSGWKDGDRGGFGGKWSSGWDKGDAGGFGGNESSGWNNGDGGGFAAKGSSGWNNGDRGGFGGKGSSGWNNGDRGDFGGKGSSGWDNGDRDPGGNGSSGWNNSDKGVAYHGDGSSVWNDGGEQVEGSTGPSKNWKQGEASNKDQWSSWKYGTEGNVGSREKPDVQWSSWKSGAEGDDQSRHQTNVWETGAKQGVFSGEAKQGVFSGENSTNWNSDTRGRRFGGETSSEWKNVDKIATGSSDWNTGEPSNRGQWSSWKSGTRSNGDQASGWGKGCGSPSKEGDGGAPCWERREIETRESKNQEAGWSKKGKPDVEVGPSGGWSPGMAGDNDGGVNEDKKDPWGEVSGSWSKTSRPNAKGGC